MCGIAGFVSPRLGLDMPALNALAGTMAAEIVHRGPDHQGSYADVQRGLGFGFRRLSILDLSPAGHQPMASASGRKVIIFNGEIYNTEDLRPSAAGAGIVLRRHPDFRAEIDPRALAAYTRFGYVPNPLSIYRDVTQLPPGGHGTLTRSGEWSVERFWRIEEVAARRRDDAPILDEDEAIDQ